MTITTISPVDATEMDVTEMDATETDALWAEMEALWPASEAARELAVRLAAAEAIVVASADATDATKMAARLAASDANLAASVAQLAVSAVARVWIEERTALWAAMGL